MNEITITGFYGWLKREKGMSGYLDSKTMMKLFPEYVEHVRAKSKKKEIIL